MEGARTKAPILRIAVGTKFTQRPLPVEIAVRVDLKHHARVDPVGPRASRQSVGDQGQMM